MLRRFPFHRVAQGLTGALLLFALACSGSGDSTGPDPAPPDDDPPGPVLPGPNPGPQPGPGPDPGPGPVPNPEPGPEPDPDQPGWNAFATYTLTQINDGQPGQLVTLSNPDGIVIGLYRFHPTTTLTLNADGTYSLTLEYTDDKVEFLLTDEGRFTWQPVEGGILLQMSSATFGDAFLAAASPDFSAAIDYDFDGDGSIDTRFSFLQVGG